MDSHDEYLRVQREKRVAASLPAPVGRKAIEHTKYLKQNITDLATRLALVQSALTISLEGISRATVTEICNRAMKDFDVYVMPSMAGKILSQLDVRKVTSHSQNRLVLDEEQLKPLQESMSSQFEEMVPEVKEAIEKFDGVAEVVRDLHERMQNVYRQAEREQYIRNFLIKHEQEVRTVSAWEERYRQVHAKYERGKLLRETIKKLDKRAEELPSLEERKEELESRLEEHREEEEELSEKEKDISKREEALVGRDRRLRERQGLVELTELERAVKGAQGELRRNRSQLDLQIAGKRQEIGRAVKDTQKELTQARKDLKSEVEHGEKELQKLDKQLTGKRGLVDKMLGRGKEGTES